MEITPTSLATIDRQIACVLREIALRKKVYPSWVLQRRMTQEEALREIDTMEAVAITLGQVRLAYAAQIPLFHAEREAGQAPESFADRFAGEPSPDSTLKEAPGRS